MYDQYAQLIDTMYIPVKNHYLFDNCTDLFLTEWTNYWINIVRIVDY